MTDCPESIKINDEEVKCSAWTHYPPDEFGRTQHTAHTKGRTILVKWYTAPEAASD